MSQPHLVTPGYRQRPVTVGDLLALLGPDKLDEIERRVRVMREAYKCPPIVRDYKEFHERLFEFHAHYHDTFYGGDLRKLAGDDVTWRHMALDNLQRHYKSDFYRAERNVIMGREGGLIGVIDAITDGLVKFHIEIYIQSVFFDHVPNDYDLRFRLAEELIKKYGPLLFPGEDLVPHAALGMNLEEVMKAFTTHVHAIRKDWRR